MNCAKTTRLVLVDDHRLLLEALSARIDCDPGMEVVATATNAERGLRLILETQPDVAIFDVELPGRGSFDVVGEVRSRQKNTKIVFLTGLLSDVFIRQALRLKARGYFLKAESVATLLEGLRRVANGETCFSAQVQERLIFDSEANAYVVRSENKLAELTSRQFEVMRHLAVGLSVKEVARTMHLSEKSIDSHKYRIMHKLGIHDRVELARFAIREGLMQP